MKAAYSHQAIFQVSNPVIMQIITDIQKNINLPFLISTGL